MSNYQNHSPVSSSPTSRKNRSSKLSSSSPQLLSLIQQQLKEELEKVDQRLIETEKILSSQTLNSPRNNSSQNDENKIEEMNDDSEKNNNNETVENLEEATQGVELIGNLRELYEQKSSSRSISRNPSVRREQQQQLTQHQNDELIDHGETVVKARNFVLVNQEENENSLKTAREHLLSIIAQRNEEEENENDDDEKVQYPTTAHHDDDDLHDALHSTQQVEEVQEMMDEILTSPKTIYPPPQSFIEENDDEDNNEENDEEKKIFLDHETLPASSSDEDENHENQQNKETITNKTEIQQKIFSPTFSILVFFLFFFFSIAVSLSTWFILPHPDENISSSPPQRITIIFGFIDFHFTENVKLAVTIAAGILTAFLYLTGVKLFNKRQRRILLEKTRKETGELSSRIQVEMERCHEFEESISRRFFEEQYWIELKESVFLPMSEERTSLINGAENCDRSALVADFTKRSYFLVALRKLVNDEIDERMNEITLDERNEIENLRKSFALQNKENSLRKVIQDEFVVSSQRHLLSSAITIFLRIEAITRSEIVEEEMIVDRRALRKQYEIDTKIERLLAIEESSQRQREIIDKEDKLFRFLKDLFALQREEVDLRNRLIKNEEPAEFFEKSRTFLELVCEPINRNKIVNVEFGMVETETMSKFKNEMSKIKTFALLRKAKTQFVQDEEARTRNRISYTDEDEGRKQLVSSWGTVSEIIRMKNQLELITEPQERQKLIEKTEPSEFSQIQQERAMLQLYLRQRNSNSRNSPSPSPRKRNRSIPASVLGSSPSPKTKEANYHQDESSILHQNNQNHSSVALCVSADSIDSPRRKRFEEIQDEINLRRQYFENKMNYLEKNVEVNMRKEFIAEQEFQHLKLTQMFLSTKRTLEMLLRRRLEEEMKTKLQKAEQEKKNIEAIMTEEDDERSWWMMRENADFGAMQSDLRFVSCQHSVRLALFAKEGLGRERYLRAERREWLSVLRQSVHDGIFDVDTVNFVFFNVHQPNGEFNSHNHNFDGTSTSSSPSFSLLMSPGSYQNLDYSTSFGSLSFVNANYLFGQQQQDSTSSPTGNRNNNALSSFDERTFGASFALVSGGGGNEKSNNNNDNDNNSQSVSPTYSSPYSLPPPLVARKLIDQHQNDEDDDDDDAGSPASGDSSPYSLPPAGAGRRETILIPEQQQQQQPKDEGKKINLDDDEEDDDDSPLPFQMTNRDPFAATMNSTIGVNPLTSLPEEEI